MKKSVGVYGRIFPNPVLVVGTYTANGEPNAATIAWGGIASSGPASVSIAVRPSRCTFEALQRTGAFTINLATVEYAAAVDYFGITSGFDTHKFDTTGLTPVRGDFVDAPYIKEFPYNMECHVTNVVNLGEHSLFIGQVMDVKVDESILDDDGSPNWELARILSFDSSLKVYRAPGEIVGDAYSIGHKYIYM